jgi:hypothetical protein
MVEPAILARAATMARSANFTSGATDSERCADGPERSSRPLRLAGHHRGVERLARFSL